MKVQAICRVEMDGDAESRFGPVPARLSDEALREITHYWQDRLRLLHWNIHVSYAPHFELGKMGRQAECTCEQKQMSAKIRLVNPDHADASDWAWAPAEETLIHELLHLLFAPVWDSDDEAVQVREEAIINVLAHALYEQRHDQRHTSDSGFGAYLLDGVATKPGPGVYEFMAITNQMSAKMNGG